MSIPEISNELLFELASRIRPVKMGNDNQLHVVPIANENLRDHSFVWADVSQEPVVDLVAIETITTLHTYGYIGLFKPSAAEVLAQLPERLRKVATAFTSVYTDEPEHERHGFHAARTTVYRAATPACDLVTYEMFGHSVQMFWWDGTAASAAAALPLIRTEVIESLNGRPLLRFNLPKAQGSAHLAVGECMLLIDGNVVKYDIKPIPPTAGSHEKEG